MKIGDSNFYNNTLINALAMVAIKLYVYCSCLFYWQMTKRHLVSTLKVNTIYNYKQDEKHWLMTREDRTDEDEGKDKNLTK